MKKRTLLFLLDSNWDFVREVSNLTLQVLKPGGKFFAQVRWKTR